MNPLRKARVLRELTQFELARRSGISPALISLIENDYVRPSPEQKSKLASALGLEVNAIWGNEGAEPRTILVENMFATGEQ